MEEQADDGAGAAVAAPAVEVDDLVGRPDPVRELHREVGHGLVLDDAAVLDAKVDELEDALRVEGPGERHGVPEVGPDRDAAPPLVLLDRRVVFALQADERRDPLLQQAPRRRSFSKSSLIPGNAPTISRLVFRSDVKTRARARACLVRGAFFERTTRARPRRGTRETRATHPGMTQFDSSVGPT